MSHERLARQVLLAKPTGKRARGRPRTRWSDYICDLAWPRLGVEPAELPEIAEIVMYSISTSLPQTSSKEKLV